MKKKKAKTYDYAPSEVVDCPNMTAAARIGIKAMQSLMDTWHSVRGNSDRDNRERLQKYGLVLADGDDMPRKDLTYSGLNIVLFKLLEVGDCDRKTGVVGSVTYQAVPDELSDMVDCAWYENDESIPDTAAALGLEIWSRDWEKRLEAEVDEGEINRWVEAGLGTSDP